MFAIIEARLLAPDVKLLRIDAPRIARRRRAGQFVIVRVNAEHGERIPLTIADSDPEAGTVTLIVQGVGKTTKLLNMLDAGDAIADIESRRHTYFVRWRDGARTEIHIVNGPTGKYLRTDKDNTTRNNLDDLPDC